ncbi:MAG: glutamine synthetase III [Clostridia bacterium]|nr:glutamine synthetase III [Clostridia bacterium]
MEKLTEYFGCMVFGDKVMRQTLAPEIYAAFRRTVDEGLPLDPAAAESIAEAMKEWAVSKGATHYTHWFQPMTGVTAEKHDSFLTPVGDGEVIMKFSGKELISGESDASSLPSGGLRATFEARGYTAWDPTSNAFIKDNVLCIPTAFCSYGGLALDKKTPLLRSMEALDRQAVRTLRLLGDTDVKSVFPNVGAEQEYFLVDKELYDKRPDLVFTGRTLFGAMPPKGQELDDHYYGAIKQRVSEYFRELDTELWKLGIPVRTEHNEVAPSQHELAPYYCKCSVAADQNQLIMEIMQNVAKRNGLVCLLHEKPFRGVNGSGKHNNWSLCTDTGVNLLSPGDTPHKNARFLLFLCAVIKAVDEYSDLLRLSVASAGNDMRLGANEAPPAVVSMFLGDELTAVLDSIDNETPYAGMGKKQLRLGADILPRIPQDSTDRNRTSPFAFTGNKFEFRMLGSADSIACANIMINTAVADSLAVFNAELEKAADLNAALQSLIRRTYREHKRVVFNGNGYGEEWLNEAVKERGLYDLRTVPDCLPRYLDQKNIDLFARHKVFTSAEVASRCEIILENYCKHINIEARTAIGMVMRDFLPAISRFASELGGAIDTRRAADPTLANGYEDAVYRRLNELCTDIYAHNEALRTAVRRTRSVEDITERAISCRDTVLPLMDRLRALVDEAETHVAKDRWPVPTYSDLLFSKI